MATERRGQALVELAVGLLAVSLVLSGLFAFTRYIIAAMDNQRTIRAEAGVPALNAHGADGAYSSAVKSATVEVPEQAAETVFGATSVEIRDEVHLPVMGL
ncbi:MAG: hypothetical protein K6F50_06365 [Kiritimatiellae bacterium]|nr:hypothetical protein [Kiritimatiellia bacterium]